MKKKYLILFLIILFFCAGCNGTITRKIRHSGFTVGSEFNCSVFYPKDNKDIYYSKIKYFTGSHVIDAEGKIYEVSLQIKYSNNENCKEVYTDIRVQAIFDNKIIKGKDNKYYYLFSQDDNPSYTQVPTTDNQYSIYNLLLKDANVVKVQSVSSNSGIYYVLKSDGNVYETVINSQDRNSPPKIVGNNIVYNRLDYNDSIIDFNYAGDSINTFVRTQNKVFRMRIKNSNECKKYADILCDYEMAEDSLFEEYKDRIITFNGTTLITDYKRMFTVAN